MNGLERSLERLVEFLDAHQVPYMVIGGVANLVWGEPRTTADIDLTVDVEKMGVNRFVSAASHFGEALVDDPVDFAEKNRVLPVRTSDGTVVDFILATLPFEMQAISRATKMRIGETEARICTAQDLLVHKVVSERARDLDDVVGILRRSRSKIDFAELDSIVVALAHDLDRPEIADKYRAAKEIAGIA